MFIYCTVAEVQSMKIDNMFGVVTKVVLVLTFLGIFSTTAFAMESNVSVEVTVTALTEITVTPTVLNWSGVTPGAAGGTKSVEIKNTGSSNITNLYSYMSTITNETTSPYGLSTAQSYSAGGIIAFRNSSQTTYWWAGRQEWNWTQTIQNTDRSAVTIPSRAAEGFFRNASVSYYWTVGNGTNTTGSLGCNNTGAIFAISDAVDNGNVTTRTPSATSITADGRDENFTYFSVNRGSSFLNGACVAVSANCNRVYVYKFDKRTAAQGFDGNKCNNAVYINAGPIAPSDIEAITADAWIPKCIPAGTLKSARWTFVAS